MMIPPQLQNTELRFNRLKAKDKIPLDPDWQKKGFKFNDSGLVEHIAAGGNYGIIGGYGRLRLLDIDDASLVPQIEAKFKTFSVKTGKGGRHFYFTSDYDKNHVLPGGAGELRMNMQFVVAPGCTHPNGNKYEVVADLPIRETTEAELVDILLPILQASPLKKTDYGKMLKGEASPGERNDGYFRTACLMRFQRIPIQTAREILTASNEKNLNPISQAELDRIISNAYSYTGQIDIEALNKAKITEIKEDELEIETADNIFLNEIPKPSWRIKDLIPKGGITYIGGVPGCGKSLLALNMALCVASGTSFLGRETEKAKVIYFDSENGVICCYNRLKHQVKGMGIPADAIKDLAVSIYPYLKFSLDGVNQWGQLKIDPSKSLAKLNKLCDSFKPDVIIYDSLVRFMEGDENNSESCKMVFDFCKKFLEKDNQISIIILHHLNKDKKAGLSLNSLRGSSELAASASCILMLQNKRNYNLLSIEKSRFVDLSKIENQSVAYKITSSEDSMCFDVCSLDELPAGSVGRAEEDYRAWIAENDIKTFYTKNFETIMKSKGHSRDAVYQLLTKLKEDGEVSTPKRGFYEVIFQTNLSEEYIE